MKNIGPAMRSCGLLVVLYFGLVLLLPANHIVMASYRVSSSQYHILLFFVVLPYIAIWFAAFYGYAKLQQYAHHLVGATEGNDFMRLSNGCKWLAWGLPIPALCAILLNSVANTHPGFHETAIILVNYITVIFPLVAFTIINSASRNLLTHARLKISSRRTHGIQIAYVVLGVIYCYFIFRQLDLSSIGSANNPYYLPIWLLIITLIIPYLYAWFVGLLAAYDILLVARDSSGVLYRQALQLVASGIAVVIASLVGVQYVHFVSPRTGHLSLNFVLVITYLIYAFTILGFYLIAIGANKLKKIEEV